MEKRAREMVYSDSGFCKGFILVWDKDPEYFKKSLWKLWKEHLLPPGELGWTFQHGLAQGSLAALFSGWRWQGEHEGWGLVERVLLLGRKLLGSLKGLF